MLYGLVRGPILLEDKESTSSFYMASIDNIAVIFLQRSLVASSWLICHVTYSNLLDPL